MSTRERRGGSSGRWVESEGETKWRDHRREEKAGGHGGDSCESGGIVRVGKWESERVGEENAQRAGRSGVWAMTAQSKNAPGRRRAVGALFCER